MSGPAQRKRPRFTPGSYSYAFNYVRDSGALARMSGAAATVYLALLLKAQWVDIGGGIAGGLVEKLGQPTLAQHTGLCERSVRDAIRELEALKLLMTLKTGRGAGIAAVYLIFTEKPAADCRFFQRRNRQPVAGEPGKIALEKRQNRSEKPAADCRPSKVFKDSKDPKGGCAAQGDKTQRHAPDAKTQRLRDFIASKTDAELADLKAQAIGTANERHRQRFEAADPRKDRMLQLAMWDVAQAAGQLPPVAGDKATG